MGLPRATLVILTSIVLCTHAGAVERLNACSAIFGPKPSAHLLATEHKEADIQAHSSGLLVTDEVAHMTDDRIPFELGGYLRVVVSPTGQWTSGFRPKEAPRALAGNTFNFVKIFGAKTAYQFGFRSLSKSEAGEARLTAPDAVALTAAIERYNQSLSADDRLSKRILVKFYESTSALPVPSVELLKRFIRGELPLERSGSVAIHDISFHTSAIALPREVLEPMQNKSDFGLWFAAKLDADGVARHRILSDQIIEALAVQVDNLGNFSNTLRAQALMSENPQSSMQKLRSRFLPTETEAALLEKITQYVEIAGVHESPYESMLKILANHNADSEVFNRLQADYQAWIANRSRNAKPIRSTSAKRLARELIPIMRSRISDLRGS